MLNLSTRCLFMILAIGTAVFSLGTPSTAQAHGTQKKVRICHAPPGRPDDRQTILVGAPAVPAHLRHGDTIGACPSGCTADPDVCDDENLCTDDFCTASGECAHQPVDCTDGNTCTHDFCVETTGCISDPSPVNGASCDDGNPCTHRDVCQASSCAGDSLQGCCLGDADCEDTSLCTLDRCVDHTCVSSVKDCSLGAVCGIASYSDACVVSYCNETDGSCATTPVACDDGSMCTVDYCNSSSGCGSVPTSEGPEEPAELTCNDGLDNDCDGVIDSTDADCVAVPDPECTPGTTETLPCGNCGVRTRFCGPTGQWDAFSTCSLQGACREGDFDYQVCGLCGDGLRERVCTSSCEWGPFGACTGASLTPPCP